MSARRTPWSRYLPLSLCGALLVTAPGYRYRIDQVRCDHWPQPLSEAHLWLLYVLGVALLSVAWIRITAALATGASPGRVRTVLLVGTLPHLLALSSPLFLSEDPLAYAAFGHAIAKYHADPRLPLDQVLPALDPFLRSVQAGWRPAASAYSPGFNALAALIARVGGDDLARQLQLYQLLGLGSMLATAWLAALAAARARRQDDPSLDPERPPLLPATEGARAAALVLFCPLAIIEGTLSAHNDGLLAVSVALAALCLVQGRRAWALAALAAGLLVKDSAILLVALYVLQLAMTRLRLRQRSARVQLAAGLGTLALGAALAWTLVPWLLRRSPTTANLLRPGARTVEYCVRSVECLPRAALFWLLHLPTAAFAINLAFRVAAVGWLLYVAVQSARDGRFLRWAATFLFLYYLYLHAVSQSWYLLALLPLLPYASGRLYRPICVFLVSLVLYYAVDIPMSCGGNDVVRWALIHVIEGLVVIAPATVCLFTFTGRRGDPGHPQRRS